VNEDAIQRSTHSPEWTRNERGDTLLVQRVASTQGRHRCHFCRRRSDFDQRVGAWHHRNRRSQPTYPAVYLAKLDATTKVATITPVFLDESSATVANKGTSQYGTSTKLALTDPDSMR